MTIVNSGVASANPAAVKDLSARGWLSAVADDFRQAVLNVALIRRIPKGQSLTYAGDEYGSAWGIVLGQVDFTSGISTIDAPIADIGLPGDWWGFRPIHRTPRGMHAVARTNLVLAELPLKQLNSMLKNRPEWWEHVSGTHAIKEMRWGIGMADLLIRDSQLRCIAVLLRLADRRHTMADGPPVTIHFTQEQLAAAANLSRYPAGKLLRELARRDLIKLGYGTITIIAAAKLRQMVDEGEWKILHQLNEK